MGRWMVVAAVALTGCAQAPYCEELGPVTYDARCDDDCFALCAAGEPRWEHDDETGWAPVDDLGVVDRAECDEDGVLESCSGEREHVCFCEPMPAD